MNNVTQFAASETGEKAGGFAALGLDLSSFIVQLITFLIVFYILKKYVFGRIIDVLDKRQKTIEQGVKSAQDMTEQKEKLEKEVAKLRSEARIQADDILAESRKQSEEIVAKSAEAATAKTDKMIEDAKKKIDEEADRSRRSLKNEIVTLVVDTTEKLIGSKVDANKDKALIDQALKSGSGK
ncbi:MAG: F0F1 ATP synthase subunit B [Patescibacteria group bacterium]